MTARKTEVIQKGTDSHGENRKQMMAVVLALLVAVWWKTLVRGCPVEDRNVTADRRRTTEKYKCPRATVPKNDHF